MVKLVWQRLSRAGLLLRLEAPLHLRTRRPSGLGYPQREHSSWPTCLQCSYSSVAFDYPGGIWSGGCCSGVNSVGDVDVKPQAL